MDNQIEIYKSADNNVEVEVQFAQDTVWLSQQQIAALFEQTKQNISLHINNSFKEGELIGESVVKESLTTAADGKKYRTKYYNLDVIISVGYRVNSKRGTQFRQWATKRLKDYLVDGYAINQKRLEERNLEVKHLKEGISILQRAIGYQAKSLDDAKDLANLLEQFSAGLLLLDDYDHETLDTKGKTSHTSEPIAKERYLRLVEAMRTEFSSDVFGKPKDGSFDSSIHQIYQSFDGKELYPTVEDKAAMLLYFIVKNHSFIDGNKRIAAACFLYFLGQNGLLYPEGTADPIIDNHALAAITLFIAVSKPDERETVKKVLISILNRRIKP